MTDADLQQRAEQLRQDTFTILKGWMVLFETPYVWGKFEDCFEPHNANIVLRDTILAAIRQAVAEARRETFETMITKINEEVTTPVDLATSLSRPALHERLEQWCRAQAREEDAP